MPPSVTQQLPPALSRTAPPPQAQIIVVALALAAILALTLHIRGGHGWQQAQNFLMGGVLGFALCRAAFGFTGPWRALLTTGRGTGARATLAMLGAAAVAVMLLGAYGGYPQIVHPVGWALLFGAFIFGIGMQLGGCCGSGTAWVAGGGSARGMVTLVFFIAGSVVGSLHAPAWWGVPTFTGRVSMVAAWGVWGAIAATLAALAVLWAGTLAVERALHGRPATAETARAAGLRRAVFGPWPPLAGGVLLGVLTGLVLVVTHQPWGITFGYTIYGAKIATAFGVDLAAIEAPFTDTAYWAQGWTQGVLEGSLWRNNAANMNIGIMLGAALAAGLVGRWRPSLAGLGAGPILAAALGGLLMGYGARISTGCNIGAMVNGIASGSLHGWAWMAAAFAGTALGVRLRPRFGLGP